MYVSLVAKLIGALFLAASFVAPALSTPLRDVQVTARGDNTEILPNLKILRVPPPPRIEAVMSDRKYSINFPTSPSFVPPPAPCALPVQRVNSPLALCTPQLKSSSSKLQPRFGGAGIVGLATYYYVYLDGSARPSPPPPLRPLRNQGSRSPRWIQTASSLYPKRLLELKLKVIGPYNYSTSRFVLELPGGGAALSPITSLVVVRASGGDPAIGVSRLIFYSEDARRRIVVSIVGISDNV
ncbi:hypothetical protein V8E53_010042 [Lactarius tabidus]